MCWYTCRASSSAGSEGHTRVRHAVEIAGSPSEGLGGKEGGHLLLWHPCQAERQDIPEYPHALPHDLRHGLGRHHPSLFRDSTVGDIRQEKNVFRRRDMPFRRSHYSLGGIGIDADAV